MHQNLITNSKLITDSVTDDKKFNDLDISRMMHIYRTVITPKRLLTVYIHIYIHIHTYTHIPKRFPEPLVFVYKVQLLLYKNVGMQNSSSEFTYTCIYARINRCRWWLSRLNY